VINALAYLTAASVVNKKCFMLLPPAALKTENFLKNKKNNNVELLV
jgi:hypothetical protein